MTTKETEKYKVLIPTAGTGSRLGNLTKYLNKSLIAVENKPVLSRIIEMFSPDTEFVIALGYKGDIVKQFLSLAYPEKKFQFVEIDKYEGEGSGLGLTILKCEKYLQESFIFCSCDTLVTDKIPYPDKNIAGYGYRENTQQYRTLLLNGDKVEKILEKNEPKLNSQPYIGLCCINDWQTFWKIMKNGGDTAIKIGESLPLKIFAQNNNLYAKKFNWFDVGNNDELTKTSEYFKEKNSPNILQKPDEAIWFIDDKVIKFSDNKKFISDRVKRTQYLKGYIPEITDYTENMYIYKKAEGTVLSAINDINILKRLLEFSKTFWTVEIQDSQTQEEFNNECLKFYKDKTKQRILLFYDTFSETDNETVINGKNYPKLSELIGQIDEQLYFGLPGRFHGDFHIENILYNEKTDTFCFLDWRQNFGKFLNIGDIYYDLAKFLHGLIICHELIVKNRFNIEVNGNIINYSFERKEILKEFENFYYVWLAENGYDVRKVKMLCALIYLNIAALHHDPYCRLLYYLGKSMLAECLQSNS